MNWLGIVAALDRVDEVEALAALAGPDPQVDLAELPAAAGLLLVPVVGLGLAEDRLQVGDVGHVGVHLQLVPVLEPLLDDVQVQVAHARDHQLVRLGVAADGEGRVLVGDLGEPDRDLGLVVAGLGLDGAGDHRDRELDRPDAKLRDRGIAADVAHGVRDVQVVELGDRHDVAGDRLVDFLLLLALEDVDVPGLGRLAAPQVDERRVGGDAAAQDAQVAELAHELVVDRLEHLGDQRAVLRREDLLLGAVGLGRARAEAVDVVGTQAAGA